MTRIGYARVSTGDQHPEAQEDKLHAAGCELVFTDKGVSGTQARRPQWDKCLANLQRGDTLVTVKLDRIGRSVANLVEVVGQLRGAGVELVVLDQNIDTRTPSGKLLFHMLAAIAEFERDLIIERTKDGQAAVRRAGNLRRSLGGVPVLGFAEGEQGDDDWQLDPIAAGWLAEAAGRVLGGEPVGAVHAALPVICDAAGRKVTPKMLRAALTRPASAGLIDGQPAAIGGPLDEPTFNRLALLFGARRRGRPVKMNRYPFGPLLRCGNCGNQLTGEPVRDRRTGAARDYYACKNPHKALGVTRPCHGCSVPAGDVHDLIRDAVMAWAATPAARLAAARGPEKPGQRRAELEAELADLLDQSADVLAKRMRIRQAAARARFDDLAAEAEVMVAEVERELAELERIDAEPGLPVVIDWDAMTAAEQLRALAEAVQTPIIVRPGNGGGAARSAADRIELVPR